MTTDEKNALVWFLTHNSGEPMGRAGDKTCTRLLRHGYLTVKRSPGRSSWRGRGYNIYSLTNKGRAAAVKATLRYVKPAKAGWKTWRRVDAPLPKVYFRSDIYGYLEYK